MSRDRPQSEHPRASAEEKDANEGRAPMDRFKSLTRHLLSVSNKQLQDERRRHPHKRRKRKRVSK